MRQGPRSSSHWAGSLGNIGLGSCTATSPLVVGLCPCLASFLVWGISGVVPSGWWAGSGLRTNKLEGCHHHLCPQGESQLLPSSLGGPLRSASGCDAGFFQITASALGVRKCEILFLPFKSRVSISYTLLAFPKASPTGLLSHTFWGLIFPVQDPRESGAQCGAQTPCSLERTLTIVIVLLFVGHLPCGCES